MPVLDDFGTEATRHAVLTQADAVPRAADGGPATPCDLPDQGDAVQWTLHADGVFMACAASTPQLPAGAYACGMDNHGRSLFSRRALQVDELIFTDDGLASQVLAEIDCFWGMHDDFASYGFLHRRGFLFYGPAGGGKTGIVSELIFRSTRLGYLTFFCDLPHHFIRAMQTLRLVEPERPILCVFEDLDAIVAKYGESEVLQWLDGNHQVNRAVNLATTNYPERLDRRLVARPRRFDRIIKVVNPGEAMRLEYFRRKLKEAGPVELARWVRVSAGLSFAALADLVISVRCLRHDLEVTAALLRELDRARASSSEFEEPEMGFRPAAGDRQVAAG